MNDAEHFLRVKFSSNKSHKNCVISEITAECQVSSILSLSHVLATRDALEFMGSDYTKIHVLDIYIKPRVIPCLLVK